MRHFRDRQVYAQIEALLQRAVPVEVIDSGSAEVAALSKNFYNVTNKDWLNGR